MSCSVSLRAGVSALALIIAVPVFAETDADTPDTKPETVTVTGDRIDSVQPATVETVTALQAAEQINVVNSEDMLKYMPSILVRKRHYGDTQDPIATRTSGVGASARSLIFSDGILISSPIGNNNTTASPHFGIAAPEDVARIDVLYGPFDARYAGNAIGTVINITTRMPDHFELYADAMGAMQPFSQYGTDRDFGTWQLAAGMGDRDGPLSWRLSANHLDSTGQPLAYVTLTQPSGASAAGTPVTGAWPALNRTAAPIAILGAAGVEHQTQDTDGAKFSYDLPDDWILSYTLSIFHQQDDATAQTYLRDGAGTPVYSGNVNIGGGLYAIPASAFSTNVYDWEQTHLAQALSLGNRPGSGTFDWSIIASDYAYLTDAQRVPSLALPDASAGGAGTITRLDGTGWHTIDGDGRWHGWANNDLSFGFHRDQESFAQFKYNTVDWIDAGPGAVATAAKGRTATDAIWLQDAWTFAPRFKATLGGRYENWQAYDGFNFSAAPALNTVQPNLSGNFFSPKTSLAWLPDDHWTLSASWGVAYRMPTVTELYQAITTGTLLTVPNPDLKPEHANSYELSAQRRTPDGSFIRLSLFQEGITNALLSQSAPLVAGSTTLYSYVQNVDRTRARGIELVLERRDAIIQGLDLSSSATYVDGRTVKDAAFPAAVNKEIPQLPKWRADATATYRPDDRWSFTLAARYSDRSYGTIDNSDPISQTFQGFGSYLVFDARMRYRFDDHWTASVGVDNLTNDTYFLYHPFPQRTFLTELHYSG